ncbi:MAG TPA: ribonuclease HI family protein [Patescibacteria group bacterium]|nr:ribonuclease HI family protein [Patescibacteria group bacterium]
MNLIIHTDGGARGNPGPAAVGVVIEEGSGVREQGTGNVLAAFGKRIGETTNNVAEYTAVIEALKYLGNRVQGVGYREHVKSIDFFLDSTLVVNQLNGLFRVKELHLRELLLRVRELEGVVGGEIHYHVIPREQNKRADFLVNQALDE